jgi:hypothetical protein
VSLPLGSKLLGEGDIRDYRASMMAEVVHKVKKVPARCLSEAAEAPAAAAVAAAAVAPAVRPSQSTENAAAAKAREEDMLGLAQQLCLETYQFRESDLEMVGASSSKLPPFAIVASKVSSVVMMDVMLIQLHHHVSSKVSVLSVTVHVTLRVRFVSNHWN